MSRIQNEGGLRGLWRKFRVQSPPGDFELRPGIQAVSTTDLDLDELAEADQFTAGPGTARVGVNWRAWDLAAPGAGATVLDATLSRGIWRFVLQETTNDPTNTLHFRRFAGIFLPGAVTPVTQGSLTYSVCSAFQSHLEAVFVIETTGQRLRVETVDSATAATRHFGSCCFYRTWSDERV